MLCNTLLLVSQDILVNISADCQMSTPSRLPEVEMPVSATLGTLILMTPTLTPQRPLPPPLLYPPQLPPPYRPLPPHPLHLLPPTFLHPQPSLPDVSSTTTTTTAKVPLPLLLLPPPPSRPVIVTPTLMEVSLHSLFCRSRADMFSCSLCVETANEISCRRTLTSTL